MGGVPDWLANSAPYAIVAALLTNGDRLIGLFRGWRESVKSDAVIARELRDELRRDIEELREQLAAERKSCDDRIEAQEHMIRNLRALVYALATRAPLDTKMRDLMAEIAPVEPSHA